MSFYTDKQYLEKKYEQAVKEADEVIGGYKISILNHASRTEKKYNVTSTDGNYYATNDKGEFLNYLREIL